MPRRPRQPRCPGLRRRIAVALALAGLAWSGAPNARASAPEVFGLGSEDAALASASSARASGAAATFYNPAGLTRTTTREVSFGLLGFASRLRAGDAPQPIAEPFGIVVGAATPVPFGGVLAERFYVGVALYVVPDAVVRVIARKPEQPFFPYYDNRTQRLVVLPALAVRIGWGFSAGIAINYLAGLSGQVVASEGYTRAVEPRVDEAIFATARANFGFLWRSPADRFAVSLVYRPSFSVPFATSSQNRIGGEPIDINIGAEGLFSPGQGVVGGAVRLLPGLRLSADFTVSFWSSWRGPFVEVDTVLPIIGRLSTPSPRLPYRDAFSLRVGAEYERPVERFLSLRLRAGYGFETSPIPTAQAQSSLLDNAKHFIGLGLGLRLTRGPIGLRLDGHGQVHVIPDVALDRPPGATAPAIHGGGTVWSAGFTLTVER